MEIKELLSLNINELEDKSKDLKTDSLPILIELLKEKNDAIRYQAFLLLQYRSAHYDDVYRYWNTFCEKIKSKNSYQRIIGLKLIAKNVKWDKDNRIDDTIEEYLLLLHDKKPITVRQCIQSLCEILPYKNHLHSKIANEVMGIKLTDVKETMRKLILLDILSVLLKIRKYQTCDEIENYISNALTGGILDKKSIRKIENIL